MSDELAYALPRHMQELATTWRVAAPVAPEAQLATAAIEAGASGEIHLRLGFAAPVRPRHMVEGTVERVGSNDVLVRAGIGPALAAHVYFGERRFEHVHYVVEGAIDAAAAGLAGQTKAPGAEIPATTSTLKIGFYRDTATGPRYVHPAIVLRTFAFFNGDVDTLLRHLLALDPGGLFFLSSFLEHLDEAAASRNKAAHFLRSLLLNEYEIILDAGLPVTSTARAAYESRLPEILLERITLADLQLLIQSQSGFEAAMATNPDRLRLWDVHDKRLRLLVIEAVNVGIDPIYVFDGFSDLWDTHQTRFFVDEKYLAIFNGGFAGAGVNLRGLDKPLAPAEGRVKFRGADAVMDEIDKIFEKKRPIVLGYRARRYHYLQRPGPANTVVFAQGRLPDPTPAAPIATGCDDLPPVIHDGTPVAYTHPDVSYFRLRLGRNDGLPMFGRAETHGKTYFFWLGRLTSTGAGPDAPQLASYDDMVSLLLLLGARDAVITDGSDSIGLMVKGRGIIPGLMPAFTKDEFIPVAIGFRKLS